jgi:hypothetical protein
MLGIDARLIGFDEVNTVQGPFTTQYEDKRTVAKNEVDTGFWMIQAVLKRNVAPTEVELKNTEAFIPPTYMLTETDALPAMPEVGLAVAVATAVIEEVGELVKVDVGVWVRVARAVTDAVMLAVTEEVGVLEDDQEGDTDGLDPYPTCNEHVITPLWAADTPT